MKPLNLPILQKIQAKWHSLSPKDRLALMGLSLFLSVVLAYLSLSMTARLSDNAKADYQTAVAEAAWFANEGGKHTASKFVSVSEAGAALSQMGINAQVQGNRISFTEPEAHAATAVAWLDTHTKLESVSMSAGDEGVTVQASVGEI